MYIWYVISSITWVYVHLAPHHLLIILSGLCVLHRSKIWKLSYYHFHNIRFENKICWEKKRVSNNVHLVIIKSQISSALNRHQNISSWTNTKKIRRVWNFPHTSMVNDYPNNFSTSMTISIMIDNFKIPHILLTLQFTYIWN